MMKKLLTAAFIITFAMFNVANAEVSNDAKLYYNQGVDNYRNGQYAQAVEAFRQAISVDANYIDAYYNLGIILQQMNENAEALNVFKQIIVRKPNDYEAVYNAALLSTKLGQEENAKKYLSIIPQDSEVYSQAQNLAYSMNTDIPTIIKEAATARAEEKAKAAAEAAASTAYSVAKNLPQDNGNYTNLISPTGLTTDKNGNLYVASFSNNSITKIAPDGTRSQFVKSTQLNGPIDIESDAEGNIYVANYNTDNVVKITPSGEISKLVSGIKKPYCLHISGGILFISSQGSNTVVRYKL